MYRFVAVVLEDTFQVIADGIQRFISNFDRSNLPSPRLPTRFIGYFRRSGWFIRRRMERPREQARTDGCPYSSFARGI